MTQQQSQPVFATIGTFDGVHLGHQAVAAHLLMLARQRGWLPKAFVLRRHPLEIVCPAKMPPQIMTYEEKAAALRKLGIEPVAIDFTEATRALTSADYMRMLRDTYNVRGLLVGYDNRFGSDRQSDISNYRKTGHELGIEVEQAKAVSEISSSIIRRLLLNGDIEEANRKSGRRFSISGHVEHGQQIGRTIGFPTANVVPDYYHKLIPANGVYAATASIPGDSAHHSAVVNIGVRPTVAGPDAKPNIEAHLLDFEGNLYNRQLRLDFVARIRDERKFNSLDELKNQISRDSDKAKEIFSDLNPDPLQQENVIL